MKQLSCFVAGLVLISGLAAPAVRAEPIAGSGSYTIKHGGLTRTFRVHLPPGYDASVAAPLVLIFHGWGGDENEFLGDRTVTSLADQRGYILVAPRGLGSGAPDNRNNSWSFSGSATGVGGDGRVVCDDSLTPDYSYPSCNNPDRPVAGNTCSWTQCQADDVDFVIELVALLESDLNIDAQNIFATGGSNGGMFTWELGQNPASAPGFRAIASLIGLPHRGYLGPPGKQDAQGNIADLPVLVITGMLDDVVPPGEWEDASFTTTSNESDRFYYTGATAITQSWAAAHHCEISVPAIPFNDGFAETDCRSYCSKDPGWPRVLDCRANMGHTYSLLWAWPLIMDFFAAHFH